MHHQHSLHATGSSYRARLPQPAMHPAGLKKNQRHQLHISRLLDTIDNMKAKIRDKEDIIYGLRCQLSATAGHASP
eukprot:3837638-Karenia_brevis.AAC.1